MANHSDGNDNDDKVLFRLDQNPKSTSEGKTSNKSKQQQQSDQQPRGKEMKLKSSQAKEPKQQHAVTKYRVIARAAPALALVELMPLTGKKHQIRMHCIAGLNCTILGETKYKLQTSPTPLSTSSSSATITTTDAMQQVLAVNEFIQQNAGPHFVHQAHKYLHLHAHTLSFAHPVIPNKTVSVSAPLPAHMVSILGLFGIDSKNPK
eukprot:c26225_g1_i1.p1 GENE.c26225_g1_i1~~c26225_g1_i1.p1  ORF type:complete len:231 (-),score=89.02 c26225_g1_i1:22-639(-)